MQQSDRQHTAILVFVRRPREEARAKRFAGSRPGVNRRIAEVLNRQVIRLARSTGLPTFVISSEQQVGDTFAERFGHALTTVFARGHQRVIAVGNDCLTLGRGHLEKAAARLSAHGLVLGPAADGGAYLIGIDRRYFSPEKLEALPWQEPVLLAALLRYGDEQGCEPFLLNRERDADDDSSFAESLAGLSINHPLRKVLRALLQALKPVLFYENPPKTDGGPATCFQRGPPFLSLFISS